MMLYKCDRCSKHCHQWGEGITFLPCPEGKVVFWSLAGGLGYKFYKPDVSNTLLGEDNPEGYLSPL